MISQQLRDFLFVGAFIIGLGLFGYIYIVATDPWVANPSSRLHKAFWGPGMFRERKRYFIKLAVVIGSVLVLFGLDAVTVWVWRIS